MIFYECTSSWFTAKCSTPKNSSSITMTFNFQIKTHRLEEDFPNQPWIFSYLSSLIVYHCLPRTFPFYYTLLLFPLNTLLQYYWTTARFPSIFLDALPWAGTPCSLSSGRYQSRNLPWFSCPKSELDALYLNSQDSWISLPLIAYLLLHFPH